MDIQTKMSCSGDTVSRWTHLKEAKMVLSAVEGTFIYITLFCIHHSPWFCIVSDEQYSDAWYGREEEGCSD